MTEPTAAEIEAARAAARRVLSEYPTAEVTLTVALTAALPLVEARLREQIAGDIEAERIPRAVGDECAYNDGIADAVRIARGR